MASPSSILPAGQHVSVLTEKVPVMIDKLPLIRGISAVRLTVTVFSLGIVFPVSNCLLRPRQRRLKCIPGMFRVIINIWVGAYLTCHVVMPDDMVCRHVVLVHQLSGQLHCCLHCRVLKVPVTAGVCLAALIAHAQLYSDAVGVAALRMLVGLRAAVPGNVLILYRLPYLSLKAHKVVGAGPDVFACIILTIGFCSACSSYIMDHDILDTA